MSNTYLAHYGVKGMKWGVWNAETRRKYGELMANANDRLDKFYVDRAENNLAKVAKSDQRYREKHGRDSVLRKQNTLIAAKRLMMATHDPKLVRYQVMRGQVMLISLGVLPLVTAGAIAPTLALALGNAGYSVSRKGREAKKDVDAQAEEIRQKALAKAR